MHNQTSAIALVVIASTFACANNDEAVATADADCLGVSFASAEAFRDTLYVGYGHEDAEITGDPAAYYLNHVTGTRDVSEVLRLCDPSALVGLPDGPIVVEGVTVAASLEDIGYETNVCCRSTAAWLRINAVIE